MTTDNKKFGNHPRKGIETASGEGKTKNNKKFGNHPHKEKRESNGIEKNSK